MGRAIDEARTTSLTKDNSPILLFDGVCHFCHNSVKFLIKRDKKSIIYYAPLQSDLAKEMLESSGYSGALPDGVILIEGGKVYFESDAALRCLFHLGGAWRLLSYLRFVPKFIRQIVYRTIARNRYKWFGKYDTCIVPESGWKERFIN